MSNIIQISSLIKSIKTLVLETSRTVQDTDVPMEILKNSANFFVEQICLQFNNAISATKFPTSFKFTNVTLVYKTGYRNQKENYRPISIFPIFAKIIEI